MKTVSQILDKKSNDYSDLENDYFNITSQQLRFNLDNTPPIIGNNTGFTVSIIIPAWNASSTILSCLVAIEQSSFNVKHQNKLQVIVVDDGSTDMTWEIIKKTKLALNLILVKQINSGQAKALNTGISIAEGDIIISCDADMVLNYYAIEHFVIRHELLPNVLLAGFRTEVTKDDVRINPGYIRQHGSHTETYFTGDERIVFSIPGWPNNMCLASNHYKSLGNAKGLWMPGDDLCEDPWRLSDLVFGALFSLSRNTYLKIGGYDEQLRGWGCTDGLLAAKAISTGHFVIPIYSASGLHISHPFRTRDKQLEYSENRRKFFGIIQTEDANNRPDWITPAKKRIVETYIQKSVSKVNNAIAVNQIQQIDPSDTLLAIGEYSKVYKIVNSTKQNHVSILKLGKALVGMGKCEEAVNVLTKLPNPTIDLIIAQAANGQFVQAHDSLVQLVQNRPGDLNLLYWNENSAQNHLLQGIKYLEQGFADIAKRCFEAILIVDPKNKSALNFRDKAHR